MPHFKRGRIDGKSQRATHYGSSDVLIGNILYISSFIRGTDSPFLVGFTDKPTLTRREKEILGLIAGGLTNLEISDKLFVSPWTGDSHRKSIMTKLNTKNTALLIKYAMENGL